ncbi:TPA: hypothetical protein ACY4SF_000981 [Clostridium perfringens]|uniref:PglD-related sugar-binding protein n=1 Tax=Clostridium perfringens TaxID=1502 RepID=UPI0013E2C81E|nr:hypothetical protein [Clostridium perfringens]MDH5098877.1 UDP-N-acetylbacillosamine N-acetyltransferase [Clostridium perfringens]MDK0683483.1 hypothetical protein [Clostridium perfringens]MDK0831573.1 hypothetical protein [Clostridium perfringens]MDK0869825.1 hypothetical protein [Clostridium perfringens]NGT61211.1 hypothetical protein [Clostridium perfringens]
MSKLIIIGAGGYGNVIYDLISQTDKFKEIYFLDDTQHGKNILGNCHSFKRYISENTVFYPAFGNNKVRVKWIQILEENNAGILTFIHKSAFISPSVNIEKGTIVMPKAIIQTNTKIKKGCIINCGSIIDHDCILEEGVHACLGCIIKADNNIPAHLKIEAGQVIENKVFKKEGIHYEN